MVGIYQGESELCDKNVKLGEFEFLLQPPRKKQDAAIQLTLFAPWKGRAVAA